MSNWFLSQRATEDFLTQTNCISCFICMNFPRRSPSLYESSDQPMVFLVRVTDFSCSQNILSILLFSLVTTFLSENVLTDLKHDIFLVFLKPKLLPPIQHKFSCLHVKAPSASNIRAAGTCSHVTAASVSFHVTAAIVCFHVTAAGICFHITAAGTCCHVKTAAASMSQLLVFPGEQSRLKRREECGHRSLLKFCLHVTAAGSMSKMSQLLVPCQRCHSCWYFHIIAAGTFLPAIAT